MNRIKTLFAGVLCMLAVNPAFADDYDNEGYPVMYLTGDFIDSPWTMKSELQFTRTGDFYSITVDSIPAGKEFKITSSAWETNFGYKASLKPNSIGETCEVFGRQDNPNFVSAGLVDVTISFRIDRQTSDKSTTVYFWNNGDKRIPDGPTGTLPVLYINVNDADGNPDNSVISRDLAHKEYFQGEYWLDLNGCEWMAEEGAESLGSESEPLPLEIKARGNYTRTAFAKKPFKLKLGKKQKMLGLSKSKHFALLAHIDDGHGFMRNYVGFNLGRRIGLPWTPSHQPVEVVINGDYRGLYFLTESIRVEEDRINIAELEDLERDRSLISGGYVVELDNYWEENQLRIPEKSYVNPDLDNTLKVTFDTPERLSAYQRHFIEQQFNAMNDYVGANSDSLWSYLDLDDAARYYLVEEIMGHHEAYCGSTYLFRDRGEGQKWHFSPLWDFGHGFSTPTNAYFYHNTGFQVYWIRSLRANPRFNQQMKQTWLWFMNNRFEGIFDDIRAYCSHIADAARRDWWRWQGRPVPPGGWGGCDNSNMTGHRDFVINYLTDRTNWLKTKFGDYTTAGITEEPVRDETPAAPLPSYITGIENVDADSFEGPAEYYNLQGIRISNPIPGEIYIEKRGTTTRKTVFR